MTMISNIMTKKPIFIPEDLSILDAIKKMYQISGGVLPVGNEKSVVGILTDRDILLRVILKQKSLSHTLIRDVMTKEIICCYEDDTLQQVIYLMSLHNIRRILIKNINEEVTGILSLGDILRRVHDKDLLADLFKTK